MSIARARPWIAGLFLAALAQAEEAEPPRTLEFDLYAFRQHDGGGNPLQAEGLDYWGVRGDFRRRLDEERVLRVHAVLAFLENASSQPIPTTVTNVATTSASADLLTLDATLSLDRTPLDSPWTFTPGIYYHQEINLISAGLEFGARRELADGDAQVAFNYTLRWDYVERQFYDGSVGTDVDRYSHTLLASWTQTLSPRTRVHLGLQYTRQDGYLANAYNFVALVDGGGAPILLTDERLPNHRNRIQLNARARYAPAVGYSIGLDTSFYTDDWDVNHYAFEPRLEMPLCESVRWRVWYRISFQEKTRFFRDAPTAQQRFQTQDSDLGSFTLQSPGTTFLFDLGKTELRWTLYGFSRNDGIDGAGTTLGAVWNW